jgi:tetratricopeptide (TPR) repeat protein
VAGLVAVLLGLGGAALVISVGEGNQEILAWPVAVWLALLFWPVRVSRPGTSKPPGGERKGKAQKPARPGYRQLAAPLAILAWAIVFATAWPAINAEAGDSRDRALAELARAGQLAGQGDLDGALAAFERIDVPATFPLDRARKHHNCGILLIRLDRKDEAAQHLALALQYDRANAQAAYLLAMLAADAGRLQDTRAMLNTALSIDPDYSPALKLQQRLARMPASPRRGER